MECSLRHPDRSSSWVPEAIAHSWFIHCLMSAVCGMSSYVRAFLSLGAEYVFLIRVRRVFSIVSVVCWSPGRTLLIGSHFLFIAFVRGGNLTSKGMLRPIYGWVKYVGTMSSSLWPLSRGDNESSFVKIGYMNGWSIKYFLFFLS